MECKCGCGNEIITNFGKKSGYLRGHWNKARRKEIVWVCGYACIYKPDHPNHWARRGYMKRSRFVMSEFLGRPLAQNEIVHHINGDKTDDRIENLVVTVNAKHTGYHAKQRRYLPDKICPTCGKSFYKGTHHSTAIFCSQSCATKGSNNGMFGKKNQHGFKLNKSQVEEIRSLLGTIPQTEIAKKFGIWQTTVSKIACGKIW